MQPLLSVQNLGKTFDGHHWIFKNLSFTLNKGTVLGIHGSNGSGKTTLLRILNTATAASQGEALIDDVSICRQPQKVRRIIGWADSQSGFYPQMTGLENLRIAGHFQRIPRAQLKMFVDAWSPCETFKKSLTRPFGLCSTGMKQILSVFLAFAKKPNLFLFDESHLGLDAATLVFLKNQIEITKGNAGFIVTSHSQSFMSDIASKTFEIQNGQLV